MHLDERATTISERNELLDNRSHTTAGWYHDQTYSHSMRITNLLVDIITIIWRSGAHPTGNELVDTSAFVQICGRRDVGVRLLLERSGGVR
jgi:hypothetical protein